MRKRLSFGAAFFMRLAAFGPCKEGLQGIVARFVPSWPCKKASGDVVARPSAS